MKLVVERGERELESDKEREGEGKQCLLGRL